MNLTIIPTLILLLLVVSGCSHQSKKIAYENKGGYYQDDGPHENPAVDISKIKNAIPRKEPLKTASNDAYTVLGKKYYPMASAKNYKKRGISSWYGKKFHGKKTAIGETYDMYAMTAAHKTLPLPCYVKVKNLKNGRSVIVRVNDRGPFLHDREIDLSYVAALKLDIVKSGTGYVEVEAIDVDQWSQIKKRRHPINSNYTKNIVSQNKQLYLQIGAFTQLSNAENLRSKLQQGVTKPVLISTEKSAGHIIHRVRIGPLASISEGDQITKNISIYGSIRTMIVTD